MDHGIKEAKDVSIREMNFFQNIIEDLPVPISVVDTNGKFILLNKAYERAFNVKREALLYRHYSFHVTEGEKSIHYIVQAEGKPYTGTKTMGNNSCLVLGEGFPLRINGQMVASVVMLNELSIVAKNMSLLDSTRQLIRESGLQKARYSFNDIICLSKGMNSAIETAKKAAATDVTVLLRGESGVGKELFAHAIHKASNRRNSNFLRVNCASLVESLLESILFGYAGSAFTGAKREGQIGLFEAAEGGTIFLDEIGDIGLSLQNKLLRVLQEREITRVGDTKLRAVDVRVILATNADLEKKIVAGLFREDLYYRINVFPVLIPPLRNRKEDIRILTELFVKKYNKEFLRSITAIDESYFDELSDYCWPGNVRELENVVVRSVINTESNQEVLKRSSIQFLPMYCDEKAEVSQIGRIGKQYDELFQAWEKHLIAQAYANAGYIKSKTAKDLNISIRSVYEKIKKYGLKRP